MRYFTIFFLLNVIVHAQKYVDLSDQLGNITHGMIINGNDYSVSEQVIINTKEINFVKPAYIRFYNVLLNVNGGIRGQGKFNLLQNSKIYIKNSDPDVSQSKLYSKKPFGKEFPLDKCKLFKEVSPGTPYTIWEVSGRKHSQGKVGDGAKIKRMFYNIKIGKKYLDRQFITN